MARGLTIIRLPRHCFMARWMGRLVILIVLVDLGAALYHYFIRRDEMLKRMLSRAIGGFSRLRVRGAELVSR